MLLKIYPLLKIKWPNLQKNNLLNRIYKTSGKHGPKL